MPAASPEKNNMSHKALLIINPVSGKKTVLRFLAEIIRCLMDEGYLVTVTVTAKHGDAEEFARKYGRGFDLVCCTGGDGTVSETVSGLASGNIDVAFGYIPCGSTNDFAVSHALETDIVKAAKNTAVAECRRYDIGRFGDRFFTNIAAFGAFSWLSYTTNQNLKNILGHSAYYLDAFRDLNKIRPYRLRLEADGVKYEGEYIFGAVCNCRCVAGAFELPDGVTDMSDGLFELLLLRMPETLPEIDRMIQSVLTQKYDCPFISFFQAEKIDIDCEEEIEWSLDGESSGKIRSVHIEPIRRFLNLKG